MMTQANTELRQRIANAGLRQWQVAEAAGITEFRFSRLMRHELEPGILQTVNDAIERLQKGRESN